jgi:DNA-binding response OmpR family regulator
MPQKPDRQPLPQPATDKRRILVVDDSRDSADSLAALLSLTGHEAHTAHDGEHAISEAEKLRPEVILLDIGLPRLNGYDACRRIREQAWGKDMVIIALTGWGQDEDRRLSTQAGFDGHLVKPVDHTALNRLLAAHGSTRG